MGVTPPPLPISPWSGNALSFNVNANSGANGLQALLPAQNGNLSLQSLTRGGTPVSFTVETIKGVSYARFAASSGAYVAQYASDTTPPTVTAVSPTCRRHRRCGEHNRNRDVQRSN